MDGWLDFVFSGCVFVGAGSMFGSLAFGIEKKTFGRYVSLSLAALVLYPQASKKCNGWVGAGVVVLGVGAAAAG